jgi:hypothetical protein
LQIRNLTFDMDPLPFTTGTVLASDPERSTFDMLVAETESRPDSPVFLKSGILRGKLHDAETGQMHGKEGDLRVVAVEPLGDRRYRLRVANNDLTVKPGLTAAFQPGLLFVLHARSDSGRGNGIEIRSSEHVLFRNVAVHGVTAHCVLAAGSAGIQFLDCALEPAAGRLALNTADGFHIPGNRKGPYLERCRVDRTNDDCMNFYSRAAAVLAESDPSRLVLPASERDAYRAGDLVALVNSNTAAVDAVGIVKSLRDAQWRGQPALELTLSDPVDAVIHSRDSTGRGPINGREYTPSGGQAYRKAMAINAPFEHLAVNLNAKNDGFIVRNCDMGHNRGGGFKCKSSNGIVENWRLSAPSMGGLFLRMEMDWREGFYPHNVLIKGCRIGGKNPLSAGAGIPRQGKVAAADLPWIRDLDVQDCRDEYGRVRLTPPAPLRTVK